MPKEKKIALSEEMIDDIPLVDIHVHLPGVISPNTAWSLGVRHKFISVEQGEFDKGYRWRSGPASLCKDNPHDCYLDIFHPDISLDEKGHPKKLSYNIDHRSFKSFDHIMATVQGHRNPPGGIQTEEDLRFVLMEYLNDCIEQKIVYVELQQNIRIAYQIYSSDEPEIARKKLYDLFYDIICEFEKSSITLRFLHCFNKTQSACLSISAHDRAMEAGLWLEEAAIYRPGVFVGLESAGHEKDESGWPEHLKDGYDYVHKLGLGCEAHGGEGIGVEHMIDVIRTLPVTRLAHGFQAIEDEKAVEEVIRRGITLVMMPAINIALGAVVHGYRDENGDIVPLAKSRGGKKQYIANIADHPFFTLMRQYPDLKIMLSSDNPQIGGQPIKKMIKMLAGLGEYGAMYRDSSVNNEPLTANELYTLAVNSINAAFCDDSVRSGYIIQLRQWGEKYGVL